jgi:hypothetical protein
MGNAAEIAQHASERPTLGQDQGRRLVVPQINARAIET